MTESLMMALTVTGTISAIGVSITALIINCRKVKKESPNEIFKTEVKDDFGKIINRLEETEGRQTSMQRQLTSLEEKHDNCQAEIVKKKLDNDNRRIQTLGDSIMSLQRVLIAMLEAQQAILSHLSDGNHKGALKEANAKVIKTLSEEFKKPPDVSGVL